MWRLFHLVFGVGGVDPLAVSAGLQQDLDGVELQQDLAGHAVKEGDVGQSCRRQQENLTAGGALTQLWRIRITDHNLVTAGMYTQIFSVWKESKSWNPGLFFPPSLQSTLVWICCPHSLMSAVTMSCMLSRKLARCCVDVWWGDVIWATTAAASARAASTLLSSVRMSARHRIPSTCRWQSHSLFPDRLNI